LVDAWDLRGPGRVPSGEELFAALQAAGPEAIEVAPRSGSVVRRNEAAWIDAGGFGKGAALRAAGRRLKGTETSKVLLDLGGQIWATSDADPWIVGVAHPERRNEPVAHLRLQGVSVATSGTSERPGHLLDPRTGRPVQAWGSVSVVSGDPVEADVLSTALFVMGPIEGRRWARAHPEVAVLFLEDREGVIRATWTPAMKQWFHEAPPEDGASSTKLTTERWVLCI
jgi:thiamine biosynthesis lipoprotein